MYLDKNLMLGYKIFVCKNLQTFEQNACVIHFPWSCRVFARPVSSQILLICRFCSRSYHEID